MFRILPIFAFAIAWVPAEAAPVFFESFESPPIPAPQYSRTIGEDGTVGAFTLVNEYSLTHYNFATIVGTAFDGDHAIAFGRVGDGAYESRIEAQLTGLVVGQDYEVSYRYAAIAFSGHYGSISVRGDIDGTLRIDAFNFFLPDIGDPGYGPVGGDGNPWLLRSFVFTATGPEHVLGFLGSTHSIGPYLLLDSVTVQSIPEPGPASLAILAALVIGGGLILRRNRRAHESQPVA